MQLEIPTYKASPSPVPRPFGIVKMASENNDTKKRKRRSRSPEGHEDVTSTKLRVETEVFPEEYHRNNSPSSGLGSPMERCYIEDGWVVDMNNPPGLDPISDPSP
jgi:hypothetical protein